MHVILAGGKFYNTSNTMGIPSAVGLGPLKALDSFQQTKTGCASGKCAGGVDPDSPPSACLLWEG